MDAEVTWVSVFSLEAELLFLEGAHFDFWHKHALYFFFFNVGEYRNFGDA